MARTAMPAIMVATRINIAKIGFMDETLYGNVQNHNIRIAG